MAEETPKKAATGLCARFSTPKSEGEGEREKKSDTWEMALSLSSKWMEAGEDTFLLRGFLGSSTGEGNGWRAGRTD